MTEGFVLSSFDPVSLAKALQGLPRELRVAYGLLVAERLYPALLAYTREVHGDEAIKVRGYLDEIWASIGSGTDNTERLRQVANGLWDIRPETEDNPSSLSSYALDAVAAAWEAVQVALTGDPSHAVAAAQIAFDSVYLHAEEHEEFEPQNSADERAIATRDVVTKELEAQETQLRRAQALASTPRAGVTVLRDEFGYPDRSSHGLS